jgi:5'-3' exonuclease
MEGAEIKRISPEKAIELLREDGVEATIEQAKIILEFMYQIAEIVVDLYLSNPN